MKTTTMSCPIVRYSTTLSCHSWSAQIGTSKFYPSTKQLLSPTWSLCSSPCCSSICLSSHEWITIDKSRVLGKLCLRKVLFLCPPTIKIIQLLLSISSFLFSNLGLQTIVGQTSTIYIFSSPNNISSSLPFSLFLHLKNSLSIFICFLRTPSLNSR